MNIFDIENKAMLALEKVNSQRAQLIKTCRHCGITNQDLALLECGEETNARQIRSAFDWLSKPHSAGFPAFLQSAPMRLESRNGRPQRAYWLTEFGRRMSYLLDPAVKARLINPRDEKDLHHRFLQLDIFTRARQDGWQAEVEKVIPYAKGKDIRCDVVIQRTEGELYIEIEQELTRNNIERAREKFRNWKAYSISENFVPNLVFVFNLPNAKLGQTLTIWEEALGSVTQDDFCMDVRYIPTGMLEGESLENVLQSLDMWMNPIRLAEPDGAASIQLSQTAAPNVWLPEANELLPKFDQCVDIYSEARTSAERLPAFLDLMTCIHEASYHSNNNRTSDCDVFNNSELPEKSLWLLRHYLTLPQNQAMYEELKEALIWVKNRSNMGLIMMRDIICSILWDTFLKHHKLAMGGNLKVSLDVPDYVNRNSSFEVKATLWKNDGLSSSPKLERDCEALSWVMTAFIWYPEFLGTGTQPWKKKINKKKGKE